MHLKLAFRSLLRKIIYQLKKPYIAYYAPLMDTTFPQSPSSKFRINSRLSQSLREIKQSDLKHNIGQLYSRTNTFATKVYSTFLPFNPNNIGNWSTIPNEEGTRRLEYELIHKIINLYHASDKNIEGYATSGGTESNLYSIWVGKSYLLKHLKLDDICLFKTNLTHYSIDKSCQLCSILQFDIPLNNQAWIMDVNSLKEMILQQIKNGKLGFIISLTLGYTETGTIDDIQAINSAITQIKRQHKNIYVSIIVDAAFDGLILPFMINDFSPFSYKNVHAIAVDFSKFTAVPYPAGVVLYRKQLRQLIEKAVPVFSMKDNTITGSRSGASVAAMWAAIHHLGKKGFRKVISRQIKLKHFFINQITQMFPNSKIITSQHSLTCGVILDTKKNMHLSKEIEDKYWLYAKKTTFNFNNKKQKTAILYKFFFLPQLTKESIQDFFTDIQRSFLNGRQ